MQYLTLLRGIQYKFFTQNLSNYEYDIMVSNAAYFLDTVNGFLI